MHWLLRRKYSLLVMLSLVFQPGCSLARSAGGEFAAGAVARVAESDSSLFALQRSLTDSAGAFLEVEFSDAVLRPARSTWAAMRQGVRDEGDSLGVRIETLLQSSLTETIPAALDSSADQLETRAAGFGRAFATEFAIALGEGMSAYVGPAADSMVANVIRAAVRGVAVDLEPAVHSLMLGVRDSLALRIGDVDRAVAGTRTVSGFRYALYGAGATAVLVSLFSALGGWKRKGRALDALIEAIERGGHEGTKEAVEACAQDAGVESWLRSRIRRRRAALKEASANASPGNLD